MSVSNGFSSGNSNLSDILNSSRDNFKHMKENTCLSYMHCILTSTFPFFIVDSISLCEKKILYSVSFQ